VLCGRIHTQHGAVHVSKLPPGWHLVASCKRCNYGDGRRVAADNRRQQIAHLHQLVAE
jgi:hypothetical protein